MVAGTWREPLSPDFDARAKWLASELRGLSEGASARPDLAAALRRLAGMRIPFERQSQMQRLGMLAHSANAVLPGFRALRILGIGNRTLDFLAKDMAAAAPARGLTVEMLTAGFDSAAALALGGTAPLPEGRFDAVLLMLDSAAFAEPAPLLDLAADDRRYEAARRYLAHLADGLKARFGAPLIVATLPAVAVETLSSSDGGMPGSTTRLVARLNAHIHEEGAKRRWITWDLAHLAARLGSYAFHDPVRLYLAKAPYALEIGPHVADSLTSLLAALAGKSARALVLDLDNTLWGGVVADDGLEGLRLGQGSAEGEAFIAFQRHVLAWRERGIVLAVCSKNVEKLAREPFRHHPDMHIREEHIAVFVADFNDKASNVSRIAQALDLGLESLVFVDDNPAERERVRAELPFVAVPEMPEDISLFPSVLIDAGYFEHLPLTQEDIGRSRAYEGRARALEAQAAIGNYDEYLRSLAMRISVRPFDALGRARIVQLISKSNQFNLTTRRYSEADVERMEGDGTRLCWQIRLADKFADHGMISVVIIDKSDPEIWEIDTWLMSCRVLSRGVEEWLMNRLFAQAAQAQAQAIRGRYRPTARNGLVSDFFDRMTFALDLSKAPIGEERIYIKRVADYTPFTTQIAES